MTSFSLFSPVKKNQSEQGFTLIEIVMVISLLAILSVVIISLISSSSDQAQFDQTTAQLKEMRNAITGDTTLTQGGSRTSFGMAGDIGGLPVAPLTLASLVTAPGGVPAFTVSAANRFGAGWNGPYMNGLFGGTGVEHDISKDAWGRTLVYDFSVDPATITSYGADGVVGGSGINQDITVSIPSTSHIATVYGFVANHGKPVTTAEIVLNQPSGMGTVIQRSSGAAVAGAFSFANVPFGKRSLTIYVPTQAAPTQTIGPIVITVDKANFACSETQLDINP